MNERLLAFLSMPGGAEWIVVGIVALLVFGKRLPEVARSIGKSIVEFKKGVRDVKDDLDVQTRIEPTSAPKLDRDASTSSRSNPSL